MKTGEGETLTATLPVFLNSLAGEPVHVVTVNDYLARRDAEWMGPIYAALGVSVGVIQAGHDPETRQGAYARDVVYGTNSEFGFDYLRDNLAVEIEQKVQRGHGYAIVDEVDNILSDEARTPLIISGAPEQAADVYYKFAQLAKIMEPGKKPETFEAKSRDWVADFDFEPDEKHKTVAITERGVEKAERFLGIDNMYLAEHGNLVNHLIQALKAESLYKKDFRRYDKLAGMTGTALTEATEFMKIYELQVVDIPTNEPMIRRDLNDQIYKTKEGKWEAVLNEI